MNRILRVLLFATLASCGGGGGGGGSSPAVVAGSLVFPALPPDVSSATLGDVEPNGTVDTATRLPLTLGSERVIAGSCAAPDDLDGYRLEATERMHVALRLESDAPLEAALYDPATMQFVRRIETNDALVLRGSAFVVVQPTGAYRLHVTTRAIEREIRADDRRPLYLGSLGADESLTVGPGTYLVACGASGTLDAGNAVCGDAGLDATCARPLAEGTEIAAGTLVHVDVAQTTTLRLRPRRVRAVAALAPLGNEQRFFASLGDGRFGRPVRDFESGRILLRVKPGTELDLEALGCHPTEEWSDGCHLVSLEPCGGDDVDERRATLARIWALSEQPGVIWAEPDYVYRALATPTDPRWSSQWGMRLIGMPAAWDITTGSNDVVVAVVDSGWKDHPDLQGRREGGYDFIFSVQRAGDGDGRDPDPTDVGDGGNEDGTSTFHGTLVTGIIAANANNGIGIAGGTWQTKIMPLRAIGVGGGSVSDLAQAVLYAARLTNASAMLPTRRAHVINMSVGGDGYSSAMQDAINAARAAGVIIVASAGNDGIDAPSYPASYDGVISVGATNSFGTRASYSNTGATLDLLGPAGGGSFGILSTMYDDGVSPAAPTYAAFSGTSVAAPHVAAVAALILALQPDLSPDQVEGVLFQSAVDLGALGRDDQNGHGRVDARAALTIASSSVPVLAISPTSLEFDVDETSHTVTATNEGEGTLVLLAAVPSESWLSASISGNQVTIRVDRNGLDAGYFSGSVRIDSSGGSAIVDVRAASPYTDRNTTVRVHARDTTTLQIVATVTARDGFGFPALPAGSYRLEAEADLDGDANFGESGEMSGQSGVIVYDGTTRITDVVIPLSFVP